MYNILKWISLKFKQIDAVLCESNEKVTWSKADDDAILDICDSIDRITMPTHEYNTKVADEHTK